MTGAFFVTGATGTIGSAIVVAGVRDGASGIDDPPCRAAERLRSAPSIDPIGRPRPSADQ
jgi:NAD(P)-dependent dehydrogenase (short-subunit alcohol dehydrogenase family)